MASAFSAITAPLPDAIHWIFCLINLRKLLFWVTRRSEGDQEAQYCRRETLRSAESCSKELFGIDHTAVRRKAPGWKAKEEAQTLAATTPPSSSRFNEAQLLSPQTHGHHGAHWLSSLLCRNLGKHYRGDAERGNVGQAWKHFPKASNRNNALLPLPLRLGRISDKSRQEFVVIFSSTIRCVNLLRQSSTIVSLCQPAVP
ncbi:hypothetical protein C8J56DRAFT_1842 [Mycena floridula]|nr:hypothetical protein C8J56DRAFT_1842 [Mycena floridula]